MISAEAKIPFGKASDGRMVSVYEVARGLDCQCICAQCGAMLVACQGEIVRHYFRHHSVNVDCAHAAETALHRYAKQTICQHLRLGLPDGDLGPMRAAKAETSVGDLRPDVFADFEIESVAVEIFVQHRVEPDKVRKYLDRKLAAIEIDLHQYRFVDRTDEEWDEIILYAAHRYWLVPPRAVREANERRRQAELEQLRERERVAVEEYNRLSAERARQQRERDAEDRIRIARQEEQFALQRKMWAEQARKAAEDRRVNAELAEAAQRWWKRALTPPSLQDLVQAAGGYHRITPEAWEQYDAEVAAWKELIRNGARYERRVARILDAVDAVQTHGERR
jgi:hypothetical protein